MAKTAAPVPNRVGNFSAVPVTRDQCNRVLAVLSEIMDEVTHESVSYWDDVIWHAVKMTALSDETLNKLYDRIGLKTPAPTKPPV